MRSFQLEGVALPGELLRRPLAGRILQLSQLAQERIALACQVAHLDGNARAGPRPTAGNGEQAHDCQGAEDEPYRENGEGGNPVDARVAVHDAEDPGLGGMPPGHP